MNIKQLLPLSIICLQLNAATDLTTFFAAIETNLLSCLPMMDEEDRDINERDEDGNTALHIAARTGDLAISMALMGLGADRLAENDEGHTPSEIAIQNGHDGIVEFLVPPIHDAGSVATQEGTADSDMDLVESDDNSVLSVELEPFGVHLMAINQAPGRPRRRAPVGRMRPSVSEAFCREIRKRAPRRG